MAVDSMDSSRIIIIKLKQSLPRAHRPRRRRPQRCRISLCTAALRWILHSDTTQGVEERTAAQSWVGREMELVIWVVVMPGPMHQQNSIGGPVVVTIIIGGVGVLTVDMGQGSSRMTMADLWGRGEAKDMLGIRAHIRHRCGLISYEPTLGKVRCASFEEASLYLCPYALVHRFTSACLSYDSSSGQRRWTPVTLSMCRDLGQRIYR